MNIMKKGQSEIIEEIKRIQGELMLVWKQQFGFMDTFSWIIAVADEEIARLKRLQSA